MSTQPIDYDALAKQFGANGAPSTVEPTVDYDALAAQHGALDTPSAIEPPSGIPSIQPPSINMEETPLSATVNQGIGEGLNAAEGAIRSGAKKVIPFSSRVGSRMEAGFKAPARLIDAVGAKLEPGAPGPTATENKAAHENVFPFGDSPLAKIVGGATLPYRAAERRIQSGTHPP